MSSPSDESLTRFTVAGIPLITSVSLRLSLKAILSAHLPPTYGNETIPVVDTLMLLLCNITLGRQPLYELGQWVKSIDQNCFELHVEDLKAFNDDRFNDSKTYNPCHRRMREIRRKFGKTHSKFPLKTSWETPSS